MLKMYIPLLIATVIFVGIAVFSVVYNLHWKAKQSKEWAKKFH